jgi:hypothetical protein
VRWSADVDVFHDAEEAVMRSSAADVATMEAAGYAVRQELWTPSFRRAWVSKGADGVKLEWCHDSAWRFFPIETDELLGWRLHWFDAITNKALACDVRWSVLASPGHLGGLLEGPWFWSSPAAQSDAA